MSLQTELATYFASEKAQSANKAPLEMPADLPPNPSAVQRQRHADQMEEYAAALLNRSVPLTQDEKNFLAAQISAAMKALE